MASPVRGYNGVFIRESVSAKQITTLDLLVMAHACSGLESVKQDAELQIHIQDLPSILLRPEIAPQRIME